MTRQSRKSAGPQPLQDAFNLGKTAFIFAGLFSFASNILFLALPIYTNQIFSRVLSSHSISTLFVLTGGVFFVFIISGILDFFQRQILNNFAAIFDQEIASRTFAALFDKVVNRRGGSNAQPLRDIDTLRATISGPAIALLFDLPWMPLFLIILFYIDPYIGTVTVLGGTVLVVLAVMQDRATRTLRHDAAKATIQGYSYTDAALRNAEVVRAIEQLREMVQQSVEMTNDLQNSAESLFQQSDVAVRVKMLVRLLEDQLSGPLSLSGALKATSALSRLGLYTNVPSLASHSL